MPTRANRLDELARSAADVLLRGAPELATMSPQERGIVISANMHSASTLGSAVLVAFQQDPSLQAIREGWWDLGNGGGMILQDHMFPFLLINAAILGKDVKRIVRDARRFLKHRSSCVDEYVVLVGATTKHDIVLDHNIKILSWDAVPDHSNKYHFDRAADPREAFVRGSFFLHSARPGCAICFAHPKRRVLFESSDAVTSDDQAKPEERASLVNDIIKCIAVSSERPVTSIGRWTQFRDKFAASLCPTPFGWSNNAFNNFYRFNEYPDIDIKRAKDFLKGIRKFDRKQKLVLDIALDRITLSMIESNPADRIIDLGIALECLLLNDLDDNRELRYRLAIRGATYLGGTASEKHDNFTFLKLAYDVRSSAVHAGRITGNRRKTQLDDILKRLQRVCVEIAKNIVSRGCFPSWEEEYLLT